jgi:hypothetical protein
LISKNVKDFENCRDLELRRSGDVSGHHAGRTSSPETLRRRRGIARKKKKRELCFAHVFSVLRLSFHFYPLRASPPRYHAPFLREVREREKRGGRGREGEREREREREKMER